MNKLLKIAIILGITSLSHISFAQNVAIKTNLLYGGVAFTPNLGLEIGLGRKSTLELSAGYNPWNLKGSKEENKKLVHWLGHIEYRLWTCERFNGHFFGVHALGSQYNVGAQNLKFIFGENTRDYRYEGFGVGGGISYGYHWILGKRWSLEATIGIGAAWLKYDKYDCPLCGDKLGQENKMYFGPTKAGIKLIYIIK